MTKRLELEVDRFLKPWTTWRAVCILWIPEQILNWSNSKWKNEQVQGDPIDWYYEETNGLQAR